jgi:hypothetical protein
MTDDMFSNHLSSIKVMIIIHTKMMIDECQLYNELDLLRIVGLKYTLGKFVGTRSCALHRFLY